MKWVQCMAKITCHYHTLTHSETSNDREVSLARKAAPLAVSRDKVHKYLGMKLDFTENGAVMIDMIDYVKTIIADIPEEMVGKTPTPVTNHLWKGQCRPKRRKPIRSIQSSCSCSISVNRDDPMCGLQYHSCASGLAFQMQITIKY